jgi:hypothetical protein
VLCGCCGRSFCGRIALRMADASESPLILCAAQSAEISLQLIPQTFSVYVLKNIRYRRAPNLFVTHSSKFFGSRIGKIICLVYDRTHAAASIRPSFRTVSLPFSG